MNLASPGMRRRARVFASILRVARCYRELAAAALLLWCAGYAVAAGNVVEYTYDAAGNITQIRRQSPATFAITSVDPDSGPVGTTVTIYGVGFSTTPANNLVKFNGTTATVSASQTGSISTTVPSGATTGRIAVTVGGVTVTSGQDFVVTIPGGPTITSFTPVGGATGTSVSVTGTNFNTTSGATTVKLNGVTATATVSSTTALTFTVPGATSSGRITATTSVATGSSTQDFIVPPAGVTLADIVTSKRAVPDGSAVTIELYAPNTRGLVLFEGISGGYYTLQLGQVAGSPNTQNVPYSVIKPDNTVLTTGYVGASNRPTIHLPKLTASGTHSILFSPGTATFASNIKVITDPAVTVDGATISLATESPDQTTRFRFDASGNLSLGVTGLAYIGSSATNSPLSAYGPTGSQVGSSASCSPTTVGGRCRVTLSGLAADTYTAVLSPPTGVRITASALASSELTGSLVAGTPQSLNATRDGQNARYVFSETAGDNPLIKLYGVTTTPSGQFLTVWIYRPNGAVLTSGSAGAASPAAISTGPLSVTGSYTVLVEPSHAYTWTGSLRLDSGTSTTIDGTTQTLAGSYAGEALRYYFSGTSGQRVEFGLSGLTYNSASSSATSMAILTPSGSALGSASCLTSAGCETSSASLPATGTYVVTFTPPTDRTITAGTFVISTPVAGTFTIGDPAQTVTVSRSGQTARYTFSGTSGQLLRLNWSSTSLTGGTSVAVTVLKPDGTTLGTPSSFGNGATGSYNIASLPSTGTYTVVLDPATAATMSASMSLVTQ
jgi:hypothetical protein